MSGQLVLGPVVFQAFEVPECIRFGGKQRLVVHVLPGGGRIVDAMGADEAPVSWSGVFSGVDAAVRVRVLERLRREGAPWTLSWDGWRYTVVIESFEASVTNPAWIPYQLRVCVVTTGGAASSETVLAGATMDEAIALGAGAGLEGQIDDAADGLVSNDVGASIAAAGSLARLVTARNYVDSLNGTVG